MNGEPKLPIQTARLRLRDFVAEDWPAVHAYSSDADVVRFMFWGPRTEAESRSFIDRMLASQQEHPRVIWELAVERKFDRAVIGACDLTLDGDEGDLGFVLAKSAWGHGFATELSNALIEVGFEVMGLRRIFATCDQENMASMRVMEKVGMKFERELREHRIAKGRSWDSLEYAIYPATRR